MNRTDVRKWREEKNAIIRAGELPEDFDEQVKEVKRTERPLKDKISQEQEQ